MLLLVATNIDVRFIKNKTMNDPDFRKKFILQMATSCFYERGIRVVSMDDIAKKCAVSKKTIYLFYNSKTELIKEMLKNEAEAFNQHIEILKKNASNAIVEFFSFFEFLANMRSRMALIFLYDLKKSGANSGVNTYCGSIESFLQENFNRGVNEGLYHPTIGIGKQIILLDKICNLLFFDTDTMTKNSDDIKILAKVFGSYLLSKEGNNWFKQSVQNNNEE